MAGREEVGIGVATLLGMEQAPNPLPVSFRGQTLDEAGALILQILAECRDAGIAIARMELDPDLFRAIGDEVHVPVRPVADLIGEVRFYRNLVDKSPISQD